MSHLQSRNSMDMLTTHEAGRWAEVMEQTGQYDFYHLPEYHQLAEMRGEGEAVLVVYREAGCVIALPLLLREIDLPALATVSSGLRDATSVYGYAGPVASGHVQPDTALRFQSALQDLLESRGVVAAFSRLHPLLDQVGLLTGLGETVDVGFTTSIDLSLPADEQVARYRKSHRYEIKRLRSMGVVCEEADMSRLDEFVQVYQDTMRGLGADPYYFFDRTYFEFLMSQMNGVMRLFVCLDGEVVTCAALFAECHGIVGYHLAGTSALYRRLAPMKMLLDTVREWACERGAKLMHLGGGVGASRDSLLDFKLGFGGREHVFRVWRHVVLPDVYEDLCEEALGHRHTQPGSGYFPAYRTPVVSTTECEAQFAE